LTEEESFLSLVCENSLELVLLEMGVLFEELQKAKKEKLQNYRSLFSLYQRNYEEDTHLELVPVDKIISLTDTRGEFGRTWWDHISSKAGSLDSLRKRYLFDQLSKKGLHSFRSSFAEEEYKVTMYHFVEHNCYAVENDGNHRTTWAKVLNAPFIAAEVTRCRAIPEKYNNLKEIEKSKGELSKLITHYNLTYDGTSILYKNQMITDVFIPEPCWNSFDSAKKQFEYYSELIACAVELHKELNSLNWIKRKKRILSLIFGSDTTMMEHHTYKILSSLYKANWKLE
jgi:hypothetical protein